METPTPTAQPSRPPLYHYSDAGGLLGMLTSKSLWFSHIKYMNDADEWFYAMRLFDQVLHEYNGAFRSPFDTVSGMPSLQDHFTFSFSEDKDSLSQWRGYCPNGGYSFCIDDFFLDQMAQDYGFAFEKCIYEEDEQKEFIRTRIIGMNPEVLVKRRADEAAREARGEHVHFSIERAVYEITQKMVPKFYLLCLLKHPSFKEEREWRMVGSFIDNGKLRDLMKLRSSRNMLIPYLDVPIPVVVDAPDEYHPERPRQARWRIKEIVVSPHPHQELAVAACKLGIPPYLWNNIDAVTASIIPYVNW